MNGRIKKRENKFTQVSNVALKDIRLSLKAKGLYALINCLITIPDFNLYKNYLISQCKEGESAFDSCWKELKDRGYLIQEKQRNPVTNRFEYEYELLDEPESEEERNKRVSEKEKVKKQNESAKKPDHENQGMDNFNIATPSFSTPGFSTPGKVGVYNNTDLNNTDQIILTTTTEQEDKKETDAKDVVVEISSVVLELKNDIADTVGEMTYESINTLLKSVSIDTIRLYLNNWDKFKEANEIRNSVKFFKDAVLKQWDIPVINKSSNKKSHANFPQRNYTDEQYESCYKRFD